MPAILEKAVKAIKKSSPDVNPWAVGTATLQKALGVMADEIEPTQPPPPLSQVDEGLAAWGNLVRDHLVAQSGVEIVGKDGGSVHFRFRGQEFSIYIQRVR
jgi:hypothetical protein